jgi:restriction system protein
VGVDVVRQLYGLMAAHGATGGFVVTSGRFTDEATAFANVNRNPILPSAGVQFSPPGSRFGRFLSTHEPGLQLLFEPIGVAADVQRHGVMQ